MTTVLCSLDLMSDTWSATDGLGRPVPIGVRSPRSNRFVGMFYFLWLGFETTDGPYDVSKILKAHPNAMQEPNNTAWGPEQSLSTIGESHTSAITGLLING